MAKTEIITEIDLSKVTDKKISNKITEVIAEDIIDFIIERTKSGKGKDGERFPGYSAEYKKSLEFKIAGKTNKVDLTLSGEMLDSIEIIEAKNGKIKFGYSSSNPMAGRAEGNMIGSYGGKPNPGKERRFLEISQKELSRIVQKVGELPDKIQSDISKAAKQGALDIVDNFTFSIDEGED